MNPDLQISPKLDGPLVQMRARQGKNVSALVRESLEENFRTIEKKMLGEKNETRPNKHGSG